MRFAKKQTVQVALKCDVCKGVTDYPLNVFPRSVYKRHGYIMQHCGCDKSDDLGSTRHRIVGVFLEQQLPLSTVEAKELLGNLIS